MSERIGVTALLLSAILLFDSVAAKPILYRQPAHQSPVRADADDLLMLAGYGFSVSDQVVYQLVVDARPPSPPAALPTSSSGLLGIAPIVSTANIPYSLTIRLPQELRKDETYALWVRSNSEWSEPFLINDARPLWISPSYVLADEQLASLPRYLKVIGRNLQPSPGKKTLIRLIGPSELTLQAETAAPALDRYVARIALPNSLAAGNYKIAVSRDGVNWAQLDNQALEVRPNRIQPTQHRIGDTRFGNCAANDNLDDTPCITAAITAAQSKGRVAIVFGAGTWDLGGSSAPQLSAVEGMAVPAGVDLVGEGSDRTRLVRHSQWNAGNPSAVFTLYGENTVRGLTFHDSQIYQPSQPRRTFLQLGPNADRLTAEGVNSNRSVSDVAIFNNVFDKTYIAIADGGLPLAHIFITHNEFGAYQSSVELAGNRFNMKDVFAIRDSIIAYNTFKPGSWLDKQNRQGVIASQLGATNRVDFSDNFANGAAADYLYPGDDARGWRAAFFWHMNGNHEMSLVANNVATCTGDKVGDGEAIAFDNNGNTFGFDTIKDVTRATADSVSVAGPLLPTQNDRSVPIASYYLGHWIQIGGGPGLGQVRKIIAYTIDGATNEVHFKVAPAWDVPPQANKSQVSVGREFWQTYVVANTVDHRKPLCLKSNRTDKKGGVISLWTQIADSVVEGNTQYDTDGIAFQNMFSTQDPSCPECNRGTHYVSFLEIRNNIIDGEYDWDDDCSSSGIFGSLAAGKAAPPLTVGYGISIARNRIRRADAWRGGAIAFTPSWLVGPSPNRWPLVVNALIHHNSIEDFWSRPAKPCREDKSVNRKGISLGGSSLVWTPVLYANACGKIPQATDLSGTQVPIVICNQEQPDSCECPR